MEKIRVCAYCQTPIEKGFICDECKKAKRKNYNKKVQHLYYVRRREELARLRHENAVLKRELEELKNAN